MQKKTLFPQKMSSRKLEVFLPVESKLRNLSHLLTGQDLDVGKLKVCAIGENQLKKNNKKSQSTTIG